jgi:hypothetical protein
MLPPGSASVAYVYPSALLASQIAVTVVITVSTVVTYVTHATMEYSIVVRIIYDSHDKKRKKTTLHLLQRHQTNNQPTNQPTTNEHTSKKH